MSLHELFNIVVDYPITLQDVGNVVRIIVLLLGLWVVAVFARAVLTDLARRDPYRPALRPRAPARVYAYGRGAPSPALPAVEQSMLWRDLKRLGAWLAAKAHR
jgi:hypothetical protein